ncbi:GIY-YIG nuclease family protein [Pseudoalteromonas rubra]|uniref:GIY-YIG nuclease family protein n=1 Tax=Pseudoalteromonas rubra TaxID=43658 RepID=UPI000F7BAC15|nr:GIY-YIG nuclease family protein [Pseudoalteromonas rubra]
MDLIKILKIYGLNEASKTKMVRHQDSRYDLNRLFTNDQIELYQERQSKDVFGTCDQIASFIGDGSTRSKFIGLFKVAKRIEVPVNTPWPNGYLYPEMPSGNFHYHLEKDHRFEDLEGRLIIDWGLSTRSWHQWLKPKPVIEILPKGFVRNFSGYLDFVLDFKELCKVLEFSEANREWHQKLKSVAGIYLITDSITGRQYVGSAYGSEGILGRWKKYTITGHGNNEQLITLLKSNDNYSNNFRFTILRTLPKSLTKTEVIEVENLYKQKLGSKTFGLNSN